MHGAGIAAADPRAVIIIAAFGTSRGWGGGNGTCYGDVAEFAIGVRDALEVEDVAAQGARAVVIRMALGLERGHSVGDGRCVSRSVSRGWGNGRWWDVADLAVGVIDALEVGQVTAERAGAVVIGVALRL